MGGSLLAPPEVGFSTPVATPTAVASGSFSGVAFTVISGSSLVTVMLIANILSSICLRFDEISTVSVLCYGVLIVGFLSRAALILLWPWRQESESGTSENHLQHLKVIWNLC